MDLHTAGHRRGVVCAPHAAAAEAGRAILGEGGNALEAMVAMAATHRGRLSAHEPHRRRRLLAGARAEQARARDHGRRAGRRATRRRELYREHDDDPARGPLAALTVPGAVGGWMLALEAARAVGGRACRSTCCCTPRSGRRATAMWSTRSQARLTAEKLAELKDVPGFAADLPARRQAAGGRRHAEAERARLHARSTGAQRACRISIAAMSGARSPPIWKKSAAR